MLIMLENNSITVSLVCRLAGNSSGHLERACAKQVQPIIMKVHLIFNIQSNIFAFFRVCRVIMDHRDDKELLDPL